MTQEIKGWVASTLYVFVSGLLVLAVVGVIGIPGCLNRTEPIKEDTPTETPRPVIIESTSTSEEECPPSSSDFSLCTHGNDLNCWHKLGEECVFQG